MIRWYLYNRHSHGNRTNSDHIRQHLKPNKKYYIFIHFDSLLINFHILGNTLPLCFNSKFLNLQSNQHLKKSLAEYVCQYIKFLAKHEDGTFSSKHTSHFPASRKTSKKLVYRKQFTFFAFLVLYY